MLEVEFYDKVEDSLLEFAVIIAKHNNKWLFCKHKNRNTYEVPGGHRDKGEDILVTAKRELYEETGAREYTIKPVCVYSIHGYDGVIHNTNKRFGMVYYAEITSFDTLPEEFEMEKIELFEVVPKELTYPNVHPLILAKVEEILSGTNRAEDYDTAMKYLNSKPLLHMGMIEPLRRGTAKILYANTDGVLIREEKSDAYMLSTYNIEKGIELIDKISECKLITTCGLDMKDYIAKKLNIMCKLECVQAVYMDKMKHDIKVKLEIKQLELNHKDIILQHYDILSGSDIEELLKNGCIYGGYEEGILVGFVGNHLEGSIGLLEVFPQYRTRGYGRALESYIINQMINNGLVPYAQIEIDNKKSIALHEKLGFSISEDRLYWMF